ncbi:MAG: hypothetical protein R3272_15780 [Candidatus Promineifilaceae bacterium]|nr:hypothetical protein [Candidatus Promineifilaceae bacterium]
MTLYLAHLDERTRELMLEELAYDLERNALHITPYLSNQGIHDYPNLLREALREGDEESLAVALAQQRRIARTGHRRRPSGGYTIVTVPENAAEMIATDAFNRYYIRAVARRAIDEGIEELIVYRARPVEKPRPESEERLETTVNARALLEDLRAHTGEPPELGVPAGPNSGLSVRLP